MIDWTSGDNDGDGDGGDVVTRRLETDRDAPATQIVEVVADLEDADPTELPSIYRCVDDLIADLFSSPPPADADAAVTFTYQRYRIYVRQDGEARFLRPSP